MPSASTTVAGVGFIYRIQTQNPFLISSDFPVVIASRLTAP